MELPEELVKIVLKLVKLSGIRSYDEFSLLDTIQFRYRRMLEKNETIDEKTLTLITINIIRLSEKFNNADSKLTKVKLDLIFREMDITSKEFDQFELPTFQLMNFQVMTPVAYEEIHRLIHQHLTTFFSDLDFLFEVSIDILRLTYVWRIKIYER